MATYDVVVVGAGPGGLATALQLAGDGARVCLVEKDRIPGGRMKNVQGEGYTLDTGPTILQGPQVIGEIFARSGLKITDWVKLLPVDPMFRMHFWDGTDFRMWRDNARTAETLERFAPGAAAGYRRYMEEHRRKYDVAYAGFIRSPADNLFSYYSLPKLIKALPFRPWQDLYTNLDGFFRDERLNYAFSYPSKYLGLTPHTCSSVFSVVPYLEQAFGVWHPEGGFGGLSRSMLRAFESLGGEARLGTAVTAVRVRDGRADGVTLASGETLDAEAVVINADFAWAQRLLPPEARRTWSDKRLARTKFSCSTFMMYLGLDHALDLDHHVIYLSDHVRKGRERFSEDQVLDEEDPPFYLCHPSKTDPSFAPAGTSALYALIPIPNNRAGLDWPRIADAYGDRMLAHISAKLGLPDLRPHIRWRRQITGQTWEADFNVQHGAVFNLSHTLDQLGPLRPHSRAEDVQRLWWVGGGSHPGSGLITIFENALHVAGQLRGGLAPLAPLPDERYLPA